MEGCVDVGANARKEKAASVERLGVAVENKDAENGEEVVLVVDDEVTGDVGFGEADVGAGRNASVEAVRVDE